MIMAFPGHTHLLFGDIQISFICTVNIQCIVIKMLSIGITHVFSCINICQVQRKLFEHEADRPSTQTSPEGPGKCLCNETNMCECNLAYFTLFQLNSHRKLCQNIKMSIFLHWISLNKMASAVNFPMS